MKSCEFITENTHIDPRASRTALTEKMAKYNIPSDYLTIRHGRIEIKLPHKVLRSHATTNNMHWPNVRGLEQFINDVENNKFTHTHILNKSDRHNLYMYGEYIITFAYRLYDNQGIMYHLAEEKDVDSILQKGLLPSQSGEGMSIGSGQKPKYNAIFLTANPRYAAKKLDRWKKLTVTLRIDTHGLDLYIDTNWNTPRDMTSAVCFDRISPKRILKVSSLDQSSKEKTGDVGLFHHNVNKKNARDHDFDVAFPSAWSAADDKKYQEKWAWDDQDKRNSI
jgi:hypothetical protein